MRQQFGHRDPHTQLVRHYTPLAFCDEGSAILILQMPFLSGDYLGYADFSALRALSRLARTDLDAFLRILDHPGLRDGITSEEAVLVVLLELEEENAAAAAAIRALPWVQDGITYTAASNVGSIHRDVAAYEHESVVALVDMSRYANGAFAALLERPWVRDGYNSHEHHAISRLQLIASEDDALAAQILGMPFLETLGQGSAPRYILQLLADVVRTDARNLQRLLSSPKLRGGITNDHSATLALLDLELRHPRAASGIAALSWVQDGIGPLDQHGVLIMRHIALESNPVFETLLTKSWVQDGLTANESLVASGLAGMGGKSHSRTNEAATLRIMDMPFLEAIEPLDANSVNSLARLIEEDAAWDSPGSYLEQVLAHPSLHGGITDERTNVVAVLGFVVEKRPDLLDALLDPDRTIVKERSITLPHAGEVALSVIWPGVSGSDESALRTMDLLEHAMRLQEEFMDVPYPESYAIVLIADVSDKGAGGGPIIHLDPPLSDSGSVIAHETAHAYWFSGPTWIVEGGASFMDSITRRARTGESLPEPVDSCLLAENIAELVRLPHDMEALVYPSGCNYALGEGMFLELYRRLGEEAFRRGFANLYLLSRDDPRPYECIGIDNGLCYMKAAFVTDANPSDAAIAEEIIDRRYYGAS